MVSPKIRGVLPCLPKLGFTTPRVRCQVHCHGKLGEGIGNSFEVQPLHQAKVRALTHASMAMGGLFLLEGGCSTPEEAFHQG